MEEGVIFLMDVVTESAWWVSLHGVCSQPH